MQGRGQEEETGGDQLAVGATKCSAMNYCFERSVKFLRRTLTSTTFNELLYRLLATCFVMFGVAGLGFFQLFLPAIALISIVTVAETVERWLALPHITVVSAATVVFWLPLTLSQEGVSTPVEIAFSQTGLKLLKIYVLPLMIATYTGSLITLSDIWKTQIDVGVMLAVLPTLAEVGVFSLLYLFNGGPFGWALLTGFCLCSWDHRLVQRRARLMRSYRLGCQHNLPELMQSSLVINVIFSSLAATFGAQFVLPCWTSFSRNSTGSWTATGSDCAAGLLRSTEERLAWEMSFYVLSLLFGLAVAGALFVFGRYTGAPKTQMLSSLVVSSVSLLFNATLTRERQAQSEWLHAAAPASCFLSAAGLVYGWKKNESSRSSAFDSAGKVAHTRSNVKVLLYLANTAVHCCLGYIILCYSLATEEKFYLEAIKAADNADIEFPQEYRQSFRRNKQCLLVTAVVAVIGGSLAKVATVAALLRWKYGTALQHSLYIGASTVAKGNLVAVLACYILMVRVAVAGFAKLQSDGMQLSLLSGHQLAYSMDIIITMVFANIVANPLSTVVSALLGHRWARKRRAWSSNMELN